MVKTKSIFDSARVRFSTWGIIIIGASLSILAIFTPFIFLGTLIVSLPLTVHGIFSLRRANRARKRYDILLASKPQERPSYFNGTNPGLSSKENNK